MVNLPSILLDVATLQWVYLGLLIAFTINLGLLTALTANAGLRLWILSNVITAAAFPLFIARNGVGDNDVTFLLPTTLVVISASLKLLAVSSSARRRSYYLPLMFLFVLFVVSYKELSFLGMVNARLAVSLATLSIITAGIVKSAADNPRWDGLLARNFFFATLIVSSVLLGAKALQVAWSGHAFSYFGADRGQPLNMLLSLVQLIVIHVGFVAMVVGRQTRAAIYATARRRELENRRLRAEAHSRDMEALARERNSMLEVLTHEVRQPLNNAQAALEEMSRTLAGNNGANSETARLIDRSRGIIDDVVLALSNAIVGAGLIERRERRIFHPVDAVAILDLAKGDCHLECQSRIVGPDTDTPMFVFGDPVLLRLAFRNLLENALKYSVPQSPVTARLLIDDFRMGLALEILNYPARTFKPNEHLFERFVRDNIVEEGRGLGLFITREVARLHNGSVNARLAEDEQVCFELFLPA